MNPSAEDLLGPPPGPDSERPRCGCQEEGVALPAARLLALTRNLNCLR